MDSPKSVSSTESRTRVASLANKSREELERMVQSLLRMLKQRDKELKESEAKAAAISEGSTSKEANAFESERQTWAKEKSDLQAAYQKALSEKDQARQYAHEVSSQMQQLKKQLTDSEETASVVMGQKESLARQLKEVQDEGQALQQQVATLKEAVGATIEERDASFARLSEEKEHCLEMESLLSTAQQQLRQLKEESLSLQTERDQLENCRQELIAGKKQADDELEHLCGEMTDREHRSKEQIEDLYRQLTEANDLAVQLQNQKTEVVKQQEELRAELRSLTESEGDRRAACERVIELEKEVALLKGCQEGGTEGLTVPAELAKELEERIERYKENIRHLEDSLTASGNQLKEERAQRDTLEREQEGREAERNAAMKQLEEKLETATKECGDLEEVVVRAKAMETECRSALEHCQSELASEKEAVVQWKTTAESLDQRIQELESLQNENVEMTARVQELQELQKESLRQKEAASEEEMTLREMLHHSEESLKNLRENQSAERDAQVTQMKELQTELKKTQKECYVAEDRLKEMETEIGQLKAVLMKNASRLEEETQTHRIAKQRLSDEQETTQHLRQQLQEALSKIQSSEVETWKQQEASAAQQKEKEDANQKRQQELEREISNLKSAIAAREQQIGAHEEDLEKIREAAEGEKEKLKRAIVELKKRLDRATAQIKKMELEGAEMQDGHFAEKERLSAEVSHHQHQAEKFGTELKDYKAKAHLLVKNKDQELNALRAELQHRADVEVDLRVLREQFDDLTVERDNIREELTEANERFQVHLDDLVAGFQTEIDEKTSALLQTRSAKDAVATAAQEWKNKAEHFEQELLQKAQEIAVLSAPKPSVSEIEHEKAAQTCRLLEKELEDVKAEFRSYKQTTEQMSEVQQREMSRLIQSNLELRRNMSEDNGSVHSDRHFSVDQRTLQQHSAAPFDNFQLSDLLEGRETGPSFRMDDGESLTESQIVVLANKQAEREDRVHLLQKQNQEMRSEIEDLEKELELRREQERVLKSYLREADQLKKQLADAPPADLDFPYLKNTVMKLMTTGESEALLPVFAKLLDFTEEENASLVASIQGRKKAASEEASRSSGLLASLTDWSWT